MPFWALPAYYFDHNSSPILGMSVHVITIIQALFEHVLSGGYWHKCMGLHPFHGIWQVDLIRHEQLLIAMSNRSAF